MTVCLTICLTVCLFVYLTINLSINQSDRPSVCHLPVCRSVCYLPQHSIHIVRMGLEIISAANIRNPARFANQVVVKVASHVCKSWVSAPVVLHGCCPELRQEPALLRVLRNSPRAMPLSGYELVCPELASGGRSAARQDITAETPVKFGTNEHPHKAARILIIY